MTTVHGVRQGVGNKLYATTCVLFRAAKKKKKRSSLLSRVTNPLKKVLGRFRGVRTLSLP